MKSQRAKETASVILDMLQQEQIQISDVGIEIILGGLRRKMWTDRDAISLAVYLEKNPILKRKFDEIVALGKSLQMRAANRHEWRKQQANYFRNQKHRPFHILGELEHFGLFRSVCGLVYFHSLEATVPSKRSEVDGNLCRLCERRVRGVHPPLRDPSRITRRMIDPSRSG